MELTQEGAHIQKLAHEEESARSAVSWGAIAAGAFMENPPEGWKPEGWTPTAAQLSQRSERDLTLGEALATWQWWALWALLFLNTSAGISIISQESPMFQEIGKVTAVIAAGMVNSPHADVERRVVDVQSDL